MNDDDKLSQAPSVDMAKSLNGTPMMLILMMVVLLTVPLVQARPRTETQPVTQPLHRSPPPPPHLHYNNIDFVIENDHARYRAKSGKKCCSK